MSRSREAAFIVTVKRGMSAPEIYYISAQDPLEAKRRAARITRSHLFEVVDVRPACVEVA